MCIVQNRRLFSNRNSYTAHSRSERKKSRKNMKNLWREIQFLSPCRSFELVRLYWCSSSIIVQFSFSGFFAWFVFHLFVCHAFMWNFLYIYQICFHFGNHKAPCHSNHLNPRWKLKGTHSVSWFCNSFFLLQKIWTKIMLSICSFQISMGKRGI